jgi:hypothetical protein
MTSRPTLTPIAKITAYVTGGGASVVGNTTAGFLFACVAAVAGCAIFALTGHPDYAVGALVVPFIFLVIYLAMMYRHVAEYPDSSVTSEEHYAHIIGLRMSAKDRAIIVDAPPVLGGSQAVIDATADRKEGEGNANA